ncbi:Low temperature viability protein-domain-containing protein [Gloeopeniophorella convolvens]|nr:Low temperature viability protein-domain-containing protein [Gloeopeniophorella convolvens]
MPQKSIFRRPGARHFQLVHRSQRDPLINDPEASQHVLKPFVRENAKKGKSRAELESTLLTSELDSASGRPNVGEATLYGVYFDDTEYDYMQHLRTVGAQEAGVESVLVEAPVQRKPASKKTRDLPISLHDLPPEALPSTSELPRDFERQAAVQSSISGLQPGMDPHLRQVLEALDDDEFVDDGLGDDFFGELVKDGERDTDESFEYEFREDGVPSDEGEPAEGDEEHGDEGGWEARFAAFKKEQRARRAMDDSRSDGGSEGADTIGQIPDFSGRRKRRGASDASGYSMSSSSIFRTEGLRDLDDRFDQIEKQYMEDDEDEDGPQDSDDSDSAPELITSREDFESLMDDFLQNYEVAGGKMKPSLQGSGPEKLQALRLAMGRDERVKVGDPDQDGQNDDDIYAMLEQDDKRERWDVETVLTTYTSLENHPRLIRAREERKVPKIRLDPKTGFPLVDGEQKSKALQPPPTQKASVPRITPRRQREESIEEKKERKKAVKAERSTRRVEKKEKKQQFSAAVKQQSQVLAQKDARARKL